MRFLTALLAAAAIAAPAALASPSTHVPKAITVSVASNVLTVTTKGLSPATPYALSCEFTGNDGTGVNVGTSTSVSTKQGVSTLAVSLAFLDSFGIPRPVGAHCWVRSGKTFDAPTVPLKSGKPAAFTISIT